MKSSAYAVFFAAFLSLVNLHQAFAQAICNTDSSGTCNADQACAPGGCRDLVYCQVNEDCDFCIKKDGGACAGDTCLNYRCKCLTDLNCGVAGRCTEDNRCVRKDDPPECGRSCLVNTECAPMSDNGQPGDAGTPYNCTFDEKHPYVGLCCPSIVGEPEQEFSCDVGQNLAQKSGEFAFATLVAITLMGRIRRRFAARKRGPARSRLSPAPEK